MNFGWIFSLMNVLEPSVYQVNICIGDWLETTIECVEEITLTPSDFDNDEMYDWDTIMKILIKMLINH